MPAASPRGTMLGLRRARLLLGLPRAWRPPAPPRPKGGGWLRLCSAGGKEASGRWEGAAARSSPEESFVFPEYLPEKPAADVEPPPAPGEAESPRERGAEAEAEAEPGGSDGPRLPPKARRPRLRGPHRVTGAADPSVPSSGVTCSGCGAELHCQDAALAGYLPSEKYRSLVRPKEETPPREEDEGEPRGPPGGEEEGAAAAEQGPNLRALEDALCQRCWLLIHHQKALRVQLSPEEYRQRVSAALRSPPRHGRPSLVLFMADLLDLPDSVLPDLAELVGTRAHVFVLGNKVDLLPADSPEYLKRLRERLLQACVQVGLVDASRPGDDRLAGRVVNVHLLSARTGYGVEELITKLQRSWKFNGDVYLVGSTNSGKSTLFNTLLRSDYCKSKASEAIHRATVSPWPGRGEREAPSGRWVGVACAF